MRYAGGKQNTPCKGDGYRVYLEGNGRVGVKERDREAERERGRGKRRENRGPR